MVTEKDTEQKHRSSTKPCRFSLTLRIIIANDLARKPGAGEDLLLRGAMVPLSTEVELNSHRQNGFPHN
jgi:hypothetical protein